MPWAIQRGSRKMEQPQTDDIDLLILFIFLIQIGAVWWSSIRFEPVPAASALYVMYVLHVLRKRIRRIESRSVGCKPS